MTVSRGWFIVAMLPSDIYCGVEHAANSTNHGFCNVYYFCLPHFLSLRVIFPFVHIWLCVCVYAQVRSPLPMNFPRNETEEKKTHTQTTTINSISVFSRLFHDDGNFLVVAFELLYLPISSSIFVSLCLSLCVGRFACVSVCMNFPISTREYVDYVCKRVVN